MKKYISANDINKYAYCPYQYYYEQIYTVKKLRSMNKEYLQYIGVENETNKNFNKGLKFHKEAKAKYYSKNNVKIYIFIFLIICLVLVYFLCRWLWKNIY